MNFKTLLFTLLLGIGSAGIVACEKGGPLEEAGENADDAVENVSEQVEEVGEKLKEAAD